MEETNQQKLGLNIVPEKKNRNLGQNPRWGRPTP